MTRDEFESTFLTQYNTLTAYAEKRCPQSGLDIVHQAYANVIENKTYEQGKLKFAKQWVYYKVAREVARFRRKESALQQTNKDYESILRPTTKNHNGTELINE